MKAEADHRQHISKAESLDAGTSIKVKNETLFSRIFAELSFAYVVYALYGMIAWVSHLGARVPWISPYLVGYGYAKNTPVSTVADLFKYNGFTALLFVLPHSFLRPPRLISFFGLRYARAIYCVIAGATCHILIAFWRPLDMSNDGSKAFDPNYSYDEDSNYPLFTLPVPKVVHDILSVTMLLYSLYCFLSHEHTYVICGYNRARYGQDRFPKGLSPRIDIITWCGYVVWLKSGGLGFTLFSGLSILPYKVYSWDIIIRVVAAIYLRLRSQGFRLFVGKIESTHLFIWVLRFALVAAGLGYRYTLLQKEEQDNTTGIETLMTPSNIVIMLMVGIFGAIGLHRIEKMR